MGQAKFCLENHVLVELRTRQPYLYGTMYNPRRPPECSFRSLVVAMHESIAETMMLADFADWTLPVCLAFVLIFLQK